MGKKDKGAKAEEPTLTKEERKALKRKEAAIVAELEARAFDAKPKSKGKSKGKGKSKADAGPDLSQLKRKGLKALIADKTNGKTLRTAAKEELAKRDYLADSRESAEAREAAAKPVKPSPKSKTIAAAEKVLAGASSPDAIVAAETSLEAATEAGDDETIEQIKTRVQAKRAAREAAEQPVKPKGKVAAAKADKADAVVGSGETVAKSPNPASPGSARNADALEGESEVDYQWRKAKERDAIPSDEAAKSGEPSARKPLKDKAKAEAEAEAAEPTSADADAALATADLKPEGEGPVVEEVDTERGRVFAAGSTEAPTFGIPSQAPQGDFETNGNGQYKVKRPADGKTIGYTRVTTYIATNEDRTLLEKWKMHILLEGVAINDAPDEHGRIDDPVMGKVRDLIHRRDVAIAKARKADGKGKLVPGQYGTIVDGAWRDFKNALDDLGESLLELGGVHVKAAKGTELHELTELYDKEGIDAVGDLLVDGKITHADLADVEAYARALEAAGIKVLPEYIERPIVIHDEKIAGRLDRVVMCRLPGAARAARYVFDTKTGRIDLGAGKIAQQLEKYAKGVPYDLETGETLEPHKASATKGLVLHLVPGSAEAHIYVVDLGVGRVGNDLSGKVRAFRNEGKKAIDMTVDLAQPEAVA